MNIRKVVNEILKSGADNSLYQVNMNIVKRRDSSSPYIRLINKEIKNGDGLVQIYKEDNGMALDSQKF